MTFRQHLNSEKGASSILVIIMMVVLLVFGLAVLTTSLSNVRLGDRKKAWLYDYYQLEGEGAKEIAAFDQLLLEAEAEAKIYLTTNNYQEDYMLDGPLEGPLKQQVFSLVYNDLMTEKLKSAILSREDAVLYMREVDLDYVLSGGSISESQLDFTIGLPNSNYDKHLRITIQLEPANSDNLTEDFSLLNRYTITRHVQQQEPFQYDESIDFGDPFEEGGGGNPFEE